METLLQDLRYGVRMLVKNPAFTAVAVIALALGIGANSAIFSVINSVLLRPLPYPEPERLVWAWGVIQGGGQRASVSPPDYRDFRDQSQSFEHFGAFFNSLSSFNLTGTGEPERLQGFFVTANFFDALGVKPRHGRTFVPEEGRPGQGRVAVLSFGLWQRRFASDPNLVGKTIPLNGEPVMVVGVMPPDFVMPPDSRFLRPAEIWLPRPSDGPDNENRAAHFLRPVGRLKPGVTIQQAQAELDAIARRLEQLYPETNNRWGIGLVSLQEQVIGSIRPTLWVLLGAVGFVLLIACANVANLLLARASTRQREIAIRTALGAGRWRVVRQLLTESVLLGIAGGALGLLLALWGVDLLVSLSPENIPRVKEIAPDARVLGFTFLVSLITGLAFGLVPALQASRPDLNESLKEGGRSAAGGARRQRVRSLLVVAEVALSLVLLIGAGLMIKSFLRLQEVDPGFNAANVLTMQIALPGAKYRSEQQRADFYQQLQQRVVALPGVQAVGMVSELPMSGQNNDVPFHIEGRPVPQTADQRTHANFRTVNDQYFRALGIPVLKGRTFTERDAREEANVVVISEALARIYWPDQDPLGQRMRIADVPEPFEVVGVVGDVRHRGLQTNPWVEMYVPYLKRPATNLVVRAAADPLGLVAAIRAAVQAIDKDQPVTNVRSMEEVVGATVAQPRFRTLLFGIFAGLALALALVGIYGVMSYSVTQRTHEIGVRLALGAQRRDVLRLIVAQGMALAVAGVALGLLAAFVMAKLISGFSDLLFGVSATDPLTFAGIPLLLVGVALLASILPARRAMRVDPMVALRYE